MTCRKRRDQGRPHYRAVPSWRSELDADALARVLLLLMLQRLEQQRDEKTTLPDDDEVDDAANDSAANRTDGGASRPGTGSGSGRSWPGTAQSAQHWPPRHWNA